MNIRSKMLVGVVGAVLFSLGGVEGAAVAPEALKPEVLYIDLADFSKARGLRVEDHGEYAKLENNNKYGNGLSIKMDPALLKHNDPYLLLFNYFDNDSNRMVYPVGFGGAPVEEGTGSGLFYMSKNTHSSGLTDTWRWKTFRCYANTWYGNQASRLAPAGAPTFFVRSKYARWVYVLPITDQIEKQYNAIRSDLLSLMADYNRLLAAESFLQEEQLRVQQTVSVTEKISKSSDIAIFTN